MPETSLCATAANGFFQRCALDDAADFGISPAHVDEPFHQGAVGGCFAPLAKRVPHDRLVETLHDVARRIDEVDPEAEAFLGRLMAELEGHPDARCVGLLVFAAGLARRLAGDSIAQAKRCLSRFEVPQNHLPELLGLAVPFVGLANRLCNEAIMDAIAGQGRPTLIDVSIGTGRQACLLLDKLARAGRLPRLLTVIGIEPSAGALDEARVAIERTAESLGAELSFFGIVGKAEDMGAGEWRRVTQACTARPVINAAFALHRIPDAADGSDRRDAVLARLKALDPACLVLAEPDVDHRQPNFYPRFVHCVAHFGAVFRTLDRLPLEQADRDALKVGYFGREIADILGSPESQRTERHESAASWTRRLQRAGFDLGHVTTGSCFPQDGRGVIAFRQQATHVSLDAIDEPVVALFLARPVRSSQASDAEALEALAF